MGIRKRRVKVVVINHKTVLATNGAIFKQAVYRGLSFFIHDIQSQIHFPGKPPLF
jgi:hypothetical protein